MSFWRRGTENSDEKKRRERSEKERSSGKISDTTARGVIAMMALLFVFQTVTFTLHKCAGDRNADGSSPGQRFSTNADGDSGKRKTELFAFDPNTISLDSLQLLGFSQKQALTIIHYREKGGRFRKREDFSKIYTVSPEKYEELAPYISIPQQSERKNYSQSPPPEHSVKTSQPKIRKEEKVSENKVKSKEIVSNNSGEWSPSREKVCIDINEADSAALISVRGIGQYFCKAILSYRKALGSFASINQLLEIRGMDQEKFDRIKDQVFVHPSGVKKFSIAEEDEKFLRRHPYIGAYNARGIALFIQSQGKENCTLKNLCQNNILSPEDTLRLHPYMK